MKAIASVLVFSAILATASSAAETSGWVFRSLTEKGGPLCRAVMHGREVDTHLVADRDGRIGLMAINPAWDRAGGLVQFTLSADDAEPVSLATPSVQWSSWSSRIAASNSA